MSDTCPIFAWARFTLHQHIYSDLDSKASISVISEKLNSNPLFLNVEHPAVLRQYYGCDLLSAPIISNGKKIMNWYSYATSVGATFIGTDPTQFVTRKMHPTIDLISKNLHKLLINNVEYSNITSVNLTQQLNHCTMLIYYADGSLKSSSSIGFHCDCTYSSNDGSFSSSCNKHIKNTPSNKRFFR